MVTVEEAKQLVLKEFPSMPIIELGLEHSLGFALAEDIFSPFSLPSFRQSAMDGYAVNLSEQQEYSCIGEIAAGQASEYELTVGQAVRIFTGAKVPDSANAVIMQEWIQTQKTAIDWRIKVVENKKLNEGMNIRPVGEQLQRGSIALQKGAIVNPAAIGLLQSFGFQKFVYLKSLKLP